MGRLKSLKPYFNYGCVLEEHSEGHDWIDTNFLGDIHQKIIKSYAKCKIVTEIRIFAKNNHREFNVYFCLECPWGAHKKLNLKNPSYLFFFWK